MLEEAIARAGIKGKAYRYGGDEFTIRFSGSSDEEERLHEALRQIRKEKGEIPRAVEDTADGIIQKSHPLYRPEKLMVNYGTADRKIAEEAMEELYERGAITEDEIPRESEAYYAYLANVQTRIADLGVDAQKAQSRFFFLMKRIREEFPAEFPETMNLTQQQTELLVKYSQKALMGMSLRELHEKVYDPEYYPLHPDGKPNPEAAENLVKFVASKKTDEEVKITTARQLEDQIIAVTAKIKQMRDEIQKREQEIQSLRQQHEADAAKLQAYVNKEQESEEMALIKDELALHGDRASRIEDKEAQLSQLQARHDELIATRQQLQTEPQTEEN